MLHLSLDEKICEVVGVANGDVVSENGLTNTCGTVLTIEEIKKPAFL